jgi:hypothetical protein
MGALHEDVFTFKTNIVKKIKTHFMLGDFFFAENHAVCEIMSKDPGSTQTLWCLHMAYWIRKQAHARAHIPTHAYACQFPHVRAHTHTKYVILIAFHGSSGFVNAYWCYMVFTLPLLLLFKYRSTRLCMHLITMPCGHILAKKYDYFKIYVVFMCIVFETLANSTVCKVDWFCKSCSFFR